MKESQEIETGKESDKQRLHSFRDISIWIDNYDDIFSDFDPRNFSERNISDDFLNEVKKVSSESNFSISELKLLVPDKIRNAESENTIIKRLHSHFRKNNHYFFDKKRIENKRGLLFVLIGIILMVLASYLSSLNSEFFILHTLQMILEPGGWFLVWAGLDNLIYSSRERKPELEFYNKMLKSKIVFVSI